MRLIAGIWTIVALAGAGLAGLALWEQITAPPDANIVPPVPAAPQPQLAEPQPPQPPHRWAAVFGARVIPEPQPPKPPEPQPPAPEPQPPAPPLPPIDSLGFELRGVVRAGNLIWAVVGHPTGEQVLSVGDSLGQGMVITRITEEGIWVDRGGDTSELLRFPQ